jgi:hypothetical protein
MTACKDKWSLTAQPEKCKEKRGENVLSRTRDEGSSVCDGTEGASRDRQREKVHKETIVVNPSYHTRGARGPQNSEMAKQNSELNIHGRVNVARHCTQRVCAQLKSIQAWLCEVPKCRNSRADIREVALGTNPPPPPNGAPLSRG